MYFFREKTKLIIRRRSFHNIFVLFSSLRLRLWDGERKDCHKHFPEWSDRHPRPKAVAEAEAEANRP